MPRYFFDFHSKHGSNLDEEGSDLQTIDQIRKEAVGTLFAVASSDLPEGENSEFKVVVRDTDSLEVYSATLVIKGGVV